MNLEKICEYLSEIGILGYENINTFLNIYSKLNKQNYSHKENKIIETLKIYLTNNFIKNNQVSKLCASIISSYINYQIILKFQSLNNMNNLLLSKLRNKYILFFLNLSMHLLKNEPRNKRSKKRNLVKKSNSKRNINKYDKYDEENMNIYEENPELIPSDDEKECTFTPQINKNFKGYKNNNLSNVESHVYYSPAFNISSKFPINKYKNNIYTNQNISANDMNNYSYSNLNISNDNRSNASYNQYGNNFNQFPEQQYYNEYNKNNYTYYNNLNNNRMIMNNIPSYNNINNYSNISANNERNAELFFNKEFHHIQKVKDKIENLKIEKLNKLKEECTFKPKINTNYKSFYIEKESKENNVNPLEKEKSVSIPIKNKDNLLNLKEEENRTKIKKEKRKRAKSEKKKGAKIIEDLSLARKKRTEKTKRLMKERNFTPKINKNNKYKITMSFEDRRLKSIELRNKYKNAKKPENDENIENNVENILAPGEMVRFKENNNQENQNNDINEYNNINIENKDKENDNDHDKLNMDKNNEENNDIKHEENLKESKDNNNYESINSEPFKNQINENKEIEIEKNKLNLMDKIKGEHKIGFKAKKEEEENKEIKITEENSESINKIDLDMNIKNDEFSFKHFQARSKSLKDVLKKPDE